MIIKKSRDRKDERTEERRERMIKRGNPKKGSKEGGVKAAGLTFQQMYYSQKG